MILILGDFGFALGQPHGLIGFSLTSFGCREDISGFEYTQESDGIERYIQDLQNFDTVIMGRKTYEFGYKFGLKPGEPAYPHMNHYIFSKTLKFDTSHDRVKICNLQLG